MPKSAFAYVDSRGRRRLPIYDQAHVRSALSRFNQVQFESDAARDRARSRLLLAAKRHGVVPVGFIEAQLRTERTRGQADTQARRVAGLPSGTVTFLMTDIEGSTALLADMGVRYGALLAEIRRVQREKVRRAGGHDVEVHADEFLAVFSNPARALEAAIGIQHRFAEKDWHATAADPGPDRGPSRAPQPDRNRLYRSVGPCCVAGVPGGPRGPDRPRAGPPRTA